MRWDWFAASLLIVAVFIAYQQVWYAGFVWDDDHHLTTNPCIVGALGFKGIWTTSEAVYYPLVLSHFWVQHQFWGLNPLPFHLLNVAMHAACAIVLWQVLRSLRVRGAWLGAALWALHPVQAESVAWITELKNTQSCLFQLLAVYCFVKWRLVRVENQSGGGATYALALIFAVLAVLSKASTVMLPVVLGLCWWWLDGQWSWRNMRWLAAFLFVSLAASAWTIWEQKFHSGAIGEEWSQSKLDRLVIAGRDVWFYVAKLCWPHPLIFIYPRWEITSGRMASYLPSVAACAVMAGLWLNRRTSLRPLLFAFAYFVVSLFPVLGFFDVYFYRYSFVADHFQYLASIGPLALVAAGTVSLCDTFERGRICLGTVACIGLLGCGILTRRQARIYDSMETLWADTVEKNPNSWMAHNNLGLARLRQGQAEEAIRDFKEASTLNTNSAKAQYNWGNALIQLGRTDEAISHYTRAIQINPNYGAAYEVLGDALLRAGRPREAIRHYENAIRLDVRSFKSEGKLGDALFQLGHVERAIAHYEQAISNNPKAFNAEYNLGNAFIRMGRLENAIAHYKRAVEINPRSAEAYNNLGNALMQAGRMAEAAEMFKKSLAIEPAFANANNSLGVV